MSRRSNSSAIDAGPHAAQAGDELLLGEREDLAQPALLMAGDLDRAGQSRDEPRPPQAGAARSVGAHAATPMPALSIVAIPERGDHVLALHVVAGREVGDRPRQAQRAVAAAGAELAAAIGVDERALHVLGHADVPAQQPRVHVAVACRPRPVEALQLALAGRDHAGALGLRGRGRLLREALGVGALDVDEEVDAVEQRAAQAPGVAREVALRGSDSAARARARTDTGWWRRRAGSASGRSPCAGRARWPRGRPPAAGAAPRAPGAGTRTARRGRARRDGRGSPLRAPGPRRRRPGRRRRSGDAARGRAARPSARRRDAARPRCGCASPRPPPPATAAAGSRAGGARASSCPRRAARRAAGCAHRRQRWSAPRRHRCGRGRRRGRGGARGARARSRRRRAAAGARRRGGSRPPARGCWPPARPAPRRARPRAPAGAGATRPVSPARAAPSATASAPRHGRISPPSPSSPKTA